MKSSAVRQANKSQDGLLRLSTQRARKKKDEEEEEVEGEKKSLASKNEIKTETHPTLTDKFC